MSRLILASKSSIRAQLLKGAGVEFEVTGSGLDEAPIKARSLAEGADAAEIAEQLARAKADAVAARGDGWVIGADSTVDLGGRLIEKAESHREVRERLLEMRGRPHRLHSAVHLTNGRDSWGTVATATLHVRRFSEAWLDGYIARNHEAVLESVGAYQLEGEGVQLFDRIDGDYFTILGLPLLPLLDALRERELLPA